MGHEFKPGDLALIVGAFNVESNIGKSCELVEHLAAEAVSAWIDPSDGRRIRNGAGDPGWLVVGDGLTSYCGTVGWVLVDTKHLRPLKGDEQPAQVRQAERVQ